MGSHFGEWKSLKPDVLQLTWTQPFFDTDSPLHSWFPPREWAVRIPALTIVLGISAIGIFLGFKILVDRNGMIDRRPSPARTQEHGHQQ